MIQAHSVAGQEDWLMRLRKALATRQALTHTLVNCVLNALCWPLHLLHSYMIAEDVLKAGVWLLSGITKVVVPGDRMRCQRHQPSSCIAYAMTCKRI